MFVKTRLTKLNYCRTAHFDKLFILGNFFLQNSKFNIKKPLQFYQC